MDTAPNRNAASLAADVRLVVPTPDAVPPDARAGPGPALAELQNRFGAVWQIEIAEPAAFIAVRRPTRTAQHILVAHSLRELERKLVAESEPSEVTST